MPIVTRSYPAPGQYVSFQTYVRTLAMPINQPTNPFGLCHDQNEVCNNPVSYMAAGDFITLNLSLFDNINPNPANPIYGWREFSAPNYWLQIDIIEDDGNIIPIDDVNLISDNYTVGVANGGYHQRIMIDANYVIALLNLDCFVLRLRINDDPAGTTFSYCYYGRYRVVQVPSPTNPSATPNCIPTVLVEGVYNKLDCNGVFLGPISGGNGTGVPTAFYSTRYAGEFELFGFSDEIEKNENGDVISQKTFQRARLRLYPLDELAILQLQTILSADEVYINGQPWNRDTSLEKNNDFDELWYANIEFSSVDCNRNLGCS